MEDSTKKAVIVLLNQIKHVILSLEDLVLNTACVSINFDRPEEKPKSRTNIPSSDLNEDEEKHLEETLERERLAIAGSDRVLKDMWAQGAR